MEDNFAQGASYQDLQGFRDYKVGKLDFTGPCPEIDSCSTLLIKADVEIDGDLVVDGTITFNGEIDFNINICNIGKYIHTSTLDANTYNIFNPTGSTCGTLLGETAIIKTIMDGTIPQLQITCDNGVGPDPPKIELRPNNGSSNISIFYDVNKDIITSAGTATQVATISTASTGDNIILAKDIITTSDSVAMSLRTTGLAPQFSFKADANNAFVIQPTNSATGEISFFPQGNPPNPLIANLGQVSHNFTNVYTNNVISNANAAAFGLGISCPNGPISLLTGNTGVGGDIVVAVGVGHDFNVEADDILLNARTAKNINLFAKTGLSDINLSAASNVNIEALVNSITLSAPTGNVLSNARFHTMTSTDFTTMTSTNDTNITSSTGNINITSTDKDLSISSHENFTINCGGYSNANEFLTINGVNTNINTNSSQFRLGLDYPASPNLNKGEVLFRATTAGPAVNFKNIDTNTNEGTMTGVTSINGWVPPCDKRIKENIKKIDHEKKMERYDKLNKIDIVSYDYKKKLSGLLPINRHIDTGFTTQQLTSVGLDDCVVKQADNNDPQVPNQNTMIALLINAVQVLQDKVKELEKEKPFTLKSHIV